MLKGLFDSMGKNEIRGCFYILIGTTMWGFSSTVAKALFNVGISPFELVPIRLPIAAAILFVTLFFCDRQKIMISRGDLLYFIVFGVLGVVGNQRPVAVAQPDDFGAGAGIGDRTVGHG